MLRPRQASASVQQREAEAKATKRQTAKEKFDRRQRDAQSKKM